MSTKIRLNCENCDRPLSVDAEKAGRKIRCPGCQTVITIPSASSSSSSSKAKARRSESTDDAQAVPKSRPKRPASAEESDSSRPTRRSKRPTSHDPDDIWSQPLSSYSSPAIEEHEYEQFGIQPKKPRASEQDANPSDMTLTGPMILFAVGLVIAFCSVGLAFAAPQAGRIVSFIAIGLGGLLGLIGHWKIRETAYMESSSCGFKFVWVPFYQPYYICTRFSYIKIPFLVAILGNIILFIGVFGWVFADQQLEKLTGG